MLRTAAIFGIVVVCGGTARGAVLTLPSIQVQLRLPAGWQIIDDGGADGVILGTEANSDNTSTVEIFRWQPTATNLSADAAARAHEQALRAELDYERRSIEEFTTAGGGNAVLITAGAGQDGARTHTALFAGYVLHGMYYIVGTFCDHGQAQQVRNAFFDDAIYSFSPIGTRIADRLPAEGDDSGQMHEGGTVTTEGDRQKEGAPGQARDTKEVAKADRQTASGGGGTGQAQERQEFGRSDNSQKQTEGSDSQSAEKAAEKSIESEQLPELEKYRHPAGFRLRLAENWNVTVEHGCIVATAPDSSPAAELAIWPLLHEKDGDIRRRATRVLKAWSGHTGRQWETKKVRLAGNAEDVVVIEGSMATGTGGGRLEAIAGFTATDDVDLLQIISYGDDFDGKRLQRLATVAASFRWKEAWIAPVGGGEKPWRSRHGALVLPDGAPVGWVITGGVQLYNDMPAIAIQGNHPATGASFVWREPRIPVCKSPSPQLLSAGWQQGADFPPDHGTDALVIARRQSAEDACRDELLSGGLSEITASGASPEARHLLEGARSIRQTAAGNRRNATCLYAVASAPKRLGTDCWMAAFLRFSGPTGQSETAGAVLRRVIKNLRPDAAWPATGRQRAQLNELLGRARRAAKSLPTRARMQASDSHVQPVFLRLADRETPGARAVVMPERLNHLWQRAFIGDGAGGDLSEFVGD